MQLSPENDDPKWDTLRKLLRETRCRYCKHTGAIELQVRVDYVQDGPLLDPDPEDTFQQTRVRVKQISWPWAVCTNCDHESRGSLA